MIQARITRSLRALPAQSKLIRANTSSLAFSPFVTLRTQRAVPSVSRIASQRWYSATSESEAKQEEVLKEGSEGEKGASKEDATKVDPAKKELDDEKEKVIDLTDRLKRQVAEYRNLQEQTKREVQAARDFALQRFAKDLLDSVDNLDRALTTVPREKLTDANQDLVNLHSGLKMTEEILLGTLKKNGMERFDPSVEGDAFDPNKHEATFQTPQPDKKDGAVFYTQQKGFMYNGRVLRAAKVGVVKNS